MSDFLLTDPSLSFVLMNKEAWESENSNFSLISHWISRNFTDRLFPFQRITIPEILEDPWFKKGYKPPFFYEKEDANLDDVEAVFKDSEASSLLARSLIFTECKYLLG